MFSDILNIHQNSNVLAPLSPIHRRHCCTFHRAVLPSSQICLSHRSLVLKLIIIACCSTGVPDKGVCIWGLRALAGRSRRMKETTPATAVQLSADGTSAFASEVHPDDSDFFLLSLCAPSGSTQLQALWQAGGGRPSRDAVFLRVQQRPAVPSLRQPGLPLRQTLLLLQSPGGLLTNAACARSRRHSLFQRFF